MSISVEYYNQKYNKSLKEKKQNNKKLPRA